jgi:hypothetical protein
VWTYAEVLPRPYEETLRVASVELHEAVEAWSGHAAHSRLTAPAPTACWRGSWRASRLASEDWAGCPSRSTRSCATWPGFQARADALLVEYWERRAAAAEAAERRDEALLYRLRAYEAGPTADAGPGR